MWIYKDIKPVVKITGSHKHLCLFGAVGLNGKQLFREYDRFNENKFYNYLNQIHYKFQKWYLCMDKAPQHYKSQKIRHYFEKHKYQLETMNTAIGTDHVYNGTTNKPTNQTVTWSIDKGALIQNSYKLGYDTGINDWNQHTDHKDYSSD